MSIYRSILIAAATAGLLVPAVARCEVADFVFRGNRLGDAFEDVQKRAGGKLECDMPKDDRLMCEDKSLDQKVIGYEKRYVLGDIVLNWSIDYAFYDGKLSAISFSVTPDQWEALRKTVAEKYGPQTSEKALRTYINGKSLENVIVEWRTNDGTMKLHKYEEGANNERSSFFIGSMKLAMLRVEREKAKAADVARKSKSAF